MRNPAVFLETAGLSALPTPTGLFLPSQQPLSESPKLPALRADVSAKVRARHLGFLLLRRLRLCSLSEIARKCPSSVLGVPATLPHGGATCALSLQAGTRPAVSGKPDTAATRGSRWWTGGFLLRQLERLQPLSDAFLLTFRVQLCKLLLVKLLDGELNGQERVQKTPVLFSTILRDDACVLRLNEATFDQLGHIFSYRVRTHIDCASNPPVACMALICRPILDVHQIAVDCQGPGERPRAKTSFGRGK